jgi:hypothetical protein
MQVFKSVYEKAIILEPHLVPTQHEVVVCIVGLVGKLMDFMDKDSQICKEVAKCIYDGIMRRFRSFQWQAAIMSLLLEPRAYKVGSAESNIISKMLTKDFDNPRHALVELSRKLYWTYRLKPANYVDDDDLLEGLTEDTHVEKRARTEATDEDSKDDSEDMEDEIQDSIREESESVRQVEEDFTMFLVKPKAQDRVSKSSTLEFYQHLHGKMKVLNKIARLLLCIPATSAVVERFFSRAGWIMSPKRSTMSSETLRQMMIIGFDSGQNVGGSGTEEGAKNPTCTIEEGLPMSEFTLDLPMEAASADDDEVLDSDIDE